MLTQTRRQFLKSAGLAAACVLAPGCADIRLKTQGKPQQPNVLLILTDDQRFDTIAELGNENIVTPNMDRLVRSGMTLTNAYIMGSTSGAVCMPSRAMLLSGQNLFDLAKSGSTILPGHVTVPEVFRNAGFTTFATGKWHNGTESFARSFTAAEHVFFGGMSDHYKVPLHDFDPQGKYDKQAVHYHQGRHSSELFSDAAVKFLQSCTDDKPFFMYVCYTAPHDPRTAPKQYRDMYDPDKIPLPVNFMPEHPFDNGEMKIRDEKLAPWPRTEQEIRRHIADYYAMITHLDAQLGRVLDTLAQTDHLDDTIIVFTSDNGLALGRHGLMGKQNLYEHSIHIPLIIRGPGIARGQKRDTLCYLHDVYPTLCELADLSVPSSVKSSSLIPIVKGRKRDPTKTLFFAYKDFQRAVRDSRYKLIEYAVNGQRTTQLFDLEADPWEMDNLADSLSYVRKLNQLRKALTVWKEKLGDNSPSWKDYNYNQT